MALVINDRVKETSTSTGTGTFTLAGAQTGFDTFAAGIGGSNTTYYAIKFGSRY
jgi:glycerate kinase